MSLRLHGSRDIVDGGGSSTLANFVCFSKIEREGYVCWLVLRSFLRRGQELWLCLP